MAFFFFKETAKLFSRVVVPFYILASTVSDLISAHFGLHLVLSLNFYFLKKYLFIFGHTGSSLLHVFSLGAASGG